MDRGLVKIFCVVPELSGIVVTPFCPRDELSLSGHVRVCGSFGDATASHLPVVPVASPLVPDSIDLRESIVCHSLRLFCCSFASFSSFASCPPLSLSRCRISVHPFAFSLHFPFRPLAISCRSAFVLVFCLDLSHPPYGHVARVMVFPSPLYVAPTPTLEAPTALRVSLGPVLDAKHLFAGEIDMPWEAFRCHHVDVAK